jgi:hypothetical protein
MVLDLFNGKYVLCTLCVRRRADGKCDADLPEGMRFGKIDVSCEGWTRAGDSNVLQGKSDDS